MTIPSTLLPLSLLLSLYLLVTTLTSAMVISSFLELGSSPSFDMRVNPTIKSAGLGACLDFKIAKNWVGCFVNDFSWHWNLPHWQRLFPHLCFPHGLQWTCSRREVQHMWKHSEEQELLSVMNSALRSLVLALHFGPWVTSSQYSTPFASSFANVWTHQGGLQPAMSVA